ncbi:MAG: hypothetical protein JWP89_935 [Schlesneria sp.]|nr:hypothetical protein [Schlesneria sp.]
MASEFKCFSELSEAEQEEEISHAETRSRGEKRAEKKMIAFRL